MKSVADFKRAMTVGSKWMFISNWHLEPVVRTCTVSQSNSFALTHPTKDGSSWCDWPKAKEVTFLPDFRGSMITGIKIESPSVFADGIWLVYFPIDGVDEMQIAKMKGEL